MDEVSGEASTEFPDDRFSRLRLQQRREAILKAEPISLAVGSGRATLTRTVVDKKSYLLTVVME